jgi:hypothetical protein
MCRHRALSRHFGESLEACRDACDSCEPRIAAAARGRLREREAERLAAERLRRAEAAGAVRSLGPEGVAAYGRLREERERLAAAHRLPPALLLPEERLVRLAQRGVSSLEGEVRLIE